MKSIFTGNIKNRLIAIFLAIALIPTIFLGIIAFSISKQILTKQITGDFNSISRGKEQAVMQYLNGAKRGLLAYSHSTVITNSLKQINSRSEVSQQAENDILKYIKLRLKFNPFVQEFIVMDKNGRVVASTEEKESGLDKSQDPYFTEARERDFFIKDAYKSKATGKIGFVASAAVRDLETEEFLGVFAERLDLKILNEIVSDRTGLGQTGENYIVNKDGVMITESRFQTGETLSLKVDTDPVKFFLLNGLNMAGLYKDYRGNMVMGSISGESINKVFDGLGWAVISEIDIAEAFAPINRLSSIFILIIAMVIIVVVGAAVIIANGISNPIKNLADAAKEISKGDLTVYAPVNRGDEIGQLGTSFNLMVKSLNEVILKTKNAVSQITSASNEILAASQQQASGAREQSAAVSETTSASKELSKSAEQVGDTIKRVSEATIHALAGMTKIKESIGRTGQIITSLSEKSQKIGKITEVIDDVADQTNLLAVNAAIEAARAGEHGRGFTVVADEIRKLADSTAKSTKDITALIEIIQHEMTNAIVSMESSVTNVDEETRLSQESAERAKEIAMSATQQISGSKQIAEAMAGIDEAMKQVAVAAQQNQAAVKQLSELARELRDTADKFKTVKT